MRWACVLVAQVFPKWLEDMQSSGMSDLSSEDRLSEQLSRFRRGILCSAALHVQNNMAGDILHSEARTLREDVEKSTLHFGVWHNYPLLRKGVFSLQEFLREACKSGRGLPFGEPHMEARSSGKDDEYSYSKFKAKLRRIREMFPADDVEVLEEFETCHLEWLAVFLSVPDWTPHMGSTDGIAGDDCEAQTAHVSSTRITAFNLRTLFDASIRWFSRFSALSSLFGKNPTAVNMKTSVEEDIKPERTAPGLTSVAVKNLHTQLGYSGEVFFDSLSRFPLFQKTIHRCLWGNRNVLEVSLHIDNTLALSFGAQDIFMIIKKRETSERIQRALQKLEISGVKDVYSNAKDNADTSTVPTENTIKGEAVASEEECIDREE